MGERQSAKRYENSRQHARMDSPLRSLDRCPTIYHKSRRREPRSRLLVATFLRRDRNLERRRPSIPGPGLLPAREDERNRRRRNAIRNRRETDTMMLVENQKRRRELNTMMLVKTEDAEKIIYFNTMFVKLCKFAFVPLITYTCHNLDQDPTRLKPRGIWGEDDVTWCMRHVVHVNKCCKHLVVITLDSADAARSGQLTILAQGIKTYVRINNHHKNQYAAYPLIRSPLSIAILLRKHPSTIRFDSGKSWRRRQQEQRRAPRCFTLPSTTQHLW